MDSSERIITDIMRLSDEISHINLRPSVNEYFIDIASESRIISTENIYKVKYTENTQWNIYREHSDVLRNKLDAPFLTSKIPFLVLG